MVRSTTSLLFCLYPVTEILLHFLCKAQQEVRRDLSKTTGVFHLRPRTHDRESLQNPSRNLVGELFCRGKRLCVRFSSRKLSRKKENKFSFSSTGVSISSSCSSSGWFSTRNTFVCMLRNPHMLRSVAPVESIFPFIVPLYVFFTSPCLRTMRFCLDSVYAKKACQVSRQA